MKSIVTKIYSNSKNQIVQDILSTYKQKTYLIVNFIYFANLKKFIIDEKTFNKQYFKTLQTCDFLLPDGIALRTFLKSKHNLSVENFNWTDFTPFFLQETSNLKTHIAFYTVYDEKIWKTKSDFAKVEKYIKDNFQFQEMFGFLSHYSQRWQDFDFSSYRKSLNKWDFDLKIFLVWLWTPFQEIWIEENLEFFKQNNILVLNVGWLFDFRSWFEKRAPNWLRTLNLERARRFFQSPKKNFWKVLTSFKLAFELFKK